MKLSLLTIHGMGDTKENYYKELKKELKKRMKDSFSKVYFESVFYQGILQKNEERVWDRVAKKIKWDYLRKFLLFGFADAAGLENGKESKESVYSQSQLIIAKKLLSAYRNTDGERSVLIIAQSLGCQVISCYLWDAKQFADNKSPKLGIWQDLNYIQEQINGGNPLTPEELRFIQGGSLRYLYTTGCNIPIFVAAHAKDQILPAKPNDNFEWHNYYDKDDVLGWPLADLSDEYAAVVKDHQINAGSGFMGWVLKSWNPASHNQYWGDDDILDPLEKHIRALL